MERPSPYAVAKLSVCLSGSETDGYLAVDFYAEPEFESEEITSWLPGALAKGEISIQTPDYGDPLEVIFLDKNGKQVAVAKNLGQEDALLIGRILRQGEPKDLSLDNKPRFMTPNFRITRTLPEQ